MTRQLILTNKRPRSVHLTRSVRRTAGFVQVRKCLPKRMRVAISTGAHVLIHPLRLRPSRGSAKPAFDYFVKIAETPSPSSQNSIASAFFLRRLLVGILNDKGRCRKGIRP